MSGVVAEAAVQAAAGAASTLSAAVAANAAASAAASAAAASAPAAASAAKKTFRSFPVRALQANLSLGRGSALPLTPALSKITVRFGPDSCPARGPLGFFYVNELPRLHVANPRITFETEHAQLGSSALLLTLAGRTDTIDLRDCRTTTDIWTLFTRKATRAVPAAASSSPDAARPAAESAAESAEPALSA
ncbi:hypothetical protein BC831DRAFT_472476 [Entophlyctis helioformis]|nr:hypothetical protein BC831DRAFT_472476 [Entophlyctis helioformis]